MSRIVHFELPADDPERAIEFYKKVFGWHIYKWEGPIDYWLIETGKEPEPGIDGGLGRRQDPNEGVVNTIGVDSVDEAVKKIEEHGGKIVRPKQAVPGVGWLAYFEDTEGNMTGIMQDDPNAK